MNTQQQQLPPNDKRLEMFLLCIGLIIAWPALLAALCTRAVIKRARHPLLYWLIAVGLGLPGAALLVLEANIYPLLQNELQSTLLLVFHFGAPTLLSFLAHAWPVWAWSLSVFPWCALLIEALSPRSLRASLLAQEQRRRTIQGKKSQRAARKVAKAPAIINDKGVFGVVIENLNE